MSVSPLTTLFTVAEPVVGELPLPLPLIILLTTGVEGESEEEVQNCMWLGACLLRPVRYSREEDRKEEEEEESKARRLAVAVVVVANRPTDGSS
jgi:hypothetical protein